MNSAKTYVLVFFVLAAGGLAFFAWRQQQELNELRGAAMNPAERADLQKRAWEAEKRAHQFELQLGALLQHSGAEANGLVPTSASTEAGNSTTAQGRMVNDAVNKWIGAMNDPDYQKLMAEQQRGQISSRYAELFRALGLPPDKLGQLKNLLLEKQMVRNDVLLAATQQGINPMTDPDAFKQLENNLQTDVDNKIKATLGSDGYAQFQTYQDTQGQRNVVRQLQESLSYTSTPLTSAQSDQMVQLLGQTGPNQNQDKGHNNAVTDKTVSAAQSVLSAEQVNALQEIQRQQQAGLLLNQMMRDRQGATPGMPLLHP